MCRSLIKALCWWALSSCPHSYGQALEDFQEAVRCDGSSSKFKDDLQAAATKLIGMGDESRIEAGKCAMDQRLGLYEVALAHYDTAITYYPEACLAHYGA